MRAVFAEGKKGRIGTEFDDNKAWVWRKISKHIVIIIIF